MHRYQTNIATKVMEKRDHQFTSTKIQNQESLPSRALKHSKELIRAAQCNSHESPFINFKGIRLDLQGSSQLTEDHQMIAVMQGDPEQSSRGRNFCITVITLP